MVEEHSSVGLSNTLGCGAVPAIATALDWTREALEAATTLARGLSARVASPLMAASREEALQAYRYEGNRGSGR